MKSRILLPAMALTLITAMATPALAADGRVLGDKLAASAPLSEGGGRYVLGVPGGSAGNLDVGSGEFDLLRTAGALVTYRRGWTPKLRSTAAYGTEIGSSLTPRVDSEARPHWLTTSS